MWLIRNIPQLQGFTVDSLSSPEFHEYLMSPKCRTHILQATHIDPPTFGNHTLHIPEVSDSFPCPHCPKVYSVKRRLTGHISRAHPQPHISRSYADSCGTCRICLQNFHTRPRLIHHLRQSSKSCMHNYIVLYQPHSTDVRDSLDAQDRVNIQLLQKAGFSKLHACKPACRLPGPLRPLIKDLPAQPES